MGNNAKASLFYGITLKQTAMLKLMKKLGHEPERTFEPDAEYDEFDYDDEDVGEICDKFATEFGFKLVFLDLGEYTEEEGEYGIAVWEKTTYDWQTRPPRSFKIPTVAEMEKKWAALAKKLGIKKKAGWRLFTEYS